MSFPTTAWSLLDDARETSGAGSDRYRDAINRLTCLYWRPVYAFLRARGQSHEAAEELTQEFWLHCFEKQVLNVADRARGRFRNFLLVVLKRFAADHAPGRCRRQEAFEHGLVPVSALIGAEGWTFEPAANQTPDEIFMQRWAQSLVAAVREEVRAWCQQKGRPDWFVIFERFHFPAASQVEPPAPSLAVGPAVSPVERPVERPAVSPVERPSQDALAAELHVSRDQIRYALDQTAARFAELLREMLSDQVSAPGDLDHELAELQRLLAAS